MGYYINPPGESKESFLDREGVAVPNIPRITWDSVPKGFLPVVIVNNGRFMAAGIAYDKRELDEFTDLEDLRPREIFMVKIEKLLGVTNPSFANYVKEHGLI